MRLLGYSYEAEMHCIDCTELDVAGFIINENLDAKTFEDDTLDEVIDYLINAYEYEIHPILDIDESLGDTYCGNRGCLTLVQPMNYLTKEYFDEVFPELIVDTVMHSDMYKEIIIELRLSISQRQKLLNNDLWLESDYLYDKINQLFRIPIIKDMYDVDVRGHSLIVAIDFINRKC